MAANAKRPRPSKNSNGTAKTPSYNHSISIEPGKPQPAPTPPPPPGAPQPGTTNPLTHPAHPAMQSALGTQAGPPTNPTGSPLGQLTPVPGKDERQVRENIQFKDMQPVEQAQVAQQQGLDPYAPIKMVQQGVQGAIGQGASSGPVPNMLAGPYVPPGVESFPDDFAHLTTLMQQGMAPGASHQEHEFGLNAHSIARAKIAAAEAQGQSGVGSPTPPQYAPPQAPIGAAPGGAPPQVGLAPGVPPAPPGAPPVGPPMGASVGGAPPIQPGAPGGIPPALIAAIMAQQKRKPARG